MKKKTVEYGKYGYLFIAPFFVVYALFQLYPLIYTVWLSFVEYYSRGVGKTVGPSFVGLKNYASVLINMNNKYQVIEGAKLFDTQTVHAILNTMLIWICNFIPQILLALLLASWFTDNICKLKGQGAFKVMMFMPNIITASSISVLFYSLFCLGGPLSGLMQTIGMIPKEYDLMSSSGWTVGFIAFMQFWMWYGNSMIVLIAGILGINPSLYEAAMVDGANSKQQFFSITLPLLKPIIQFTLVTSAIGGLQMYDIPALFNTINGTIGGPAGSNVSNTITMYIRQTGYGISANYGKSAASSMVLFFVTLAISLVFFAVTREREPKQRHAVIK